MGYLNVITIQRLAHRLYRWHVPLLPHLLDLVLLFGFNSTMWHTAEIGKGTFCAHRGLSVAIHRHAKIGERVFIGIHAVIGGRAQDVGPPVVEDDVFIGTNAVVLCGRVGRGAIIGSGAVVLEDVPPGGVVVGNPAKLIKTLDEVWWQRKPRKVFSAELGEWVDVDRNGAAADGSAAKRAAATRGAGT